MNEMDLVEDVEESGHKVGNMEIETEKEQEPEIEMAPEEKEKDSPEPASTLTSSISPKLPSDLAHQIHHAPNSKLLRPHPNPANSESTPNGPRKGSFPSMLRFFISFAGQ